jgi:hypothetical protein
MSAWIVVGHFTDEDRRVVEVGGGARFFPGVGVGQPMLARELDVLDEHGEILGDDTVVRVLIPIPPVHAHHYHCLCAVRQPPPSALLIIQ